MSLNTQTIHEPTIHKIYWPEDLDTIKITIDEKDVLEKKIFEALQKFPEKKIGCDPHFFYDKGPLLPRRVCITSDYVFVVLNNHGGMGNFSKSGAQQKNIKFIWECNFGKLWLKKEIKSYLQKDCLRYLDYGPNCGESALGLPNIKLDTRNSKLRYYEQKASFNLTELFKNNLGTINLTSIVGLIDAVRKIHSVTYEPTRFVIDKKNYINFERSFRLFHGDISPNNIICENIERDGENFTRLMLTDFYGLGDTNTLIWTRGWAPPEFIKYAITRTKYQNMDNSTFLSKYGAKKDAWALGLIIGSILRNGMHQAYSTPIPCFTFIAEKLKFDSTNTYIEDESGLAKLKQKKINEKIDNIIENSTNNTVINIWKLVKSLLTVNPDLRPTLAEAYITINT